MTSKTIIKNSDTKMLHYDQDVFLHNKQAYFSNKDLDNIYLDGLTANWRLIDHTDKSTAQTWKMWIEIIYSENIFKRITFKERIHKPYKFINIIKKTGTLWVSEDDIDIRQIYTLQPPKEKNNA